MFPLGKAVSAGDPQQALVSANVSPHLWTQKEKGALSDELPGSGLLE